MDTIRLGPIIFDKDNNIYYSPVTMDSIKTGSLRLVDVKEDLLKVEFSNKNEEFYQTMQNLDQFIINYIINNSMELMGVTVEEDNVRDLYKTCINLPDTLEDTPNMYMSFDSIPDKDRDVELDIDLVIDKIIFFPNSYKMILKAVNVEIKNTYLPTTRCLFVSDDSEDF